jgi:NADH:ubiquinone oxidoreductase subunit C
VREVKEFFGLNSLKTADSRNLLLDYSLCTSPLKKVFPTQGLEEVYFNFYTQQVNYYPVNLIEL